MTSLAGFTTPIRRYTSMRAHRVLGGRAISNKPMFGGGKRRTSSCGWTASCAR